MAVRLPVRLLTGLPGRLAVRNTATNPVRMASAAAPVIMLIATGTLYMQSTEDSVSARSYEEGISADYVLDSDAGGFRPELGMARDPLRCLTPGTTSVSTVEPIGALANRPVAAPPDVP
ncbi:hypothetical protein [Streptomyces niveus]|uniref:hypothetical protein n=1 Tax=Streptomyces niveus TaxID=193462 RepID=UPI00364C2CFA